MKTLLLATTCLTLSCAASMAADLPMQTKAPVYAAPAFNWTGFYIGAQGGGGLISNNSEGSNGNGAIAGGQFGYNYQDGNWVFGIEGEGYWSGIKGIGNSSEVPNLIFNNTATDIDRSSVKNNYDFTIAGRLGIAFDRTLIYGKGGWAWGNYSFDSSFTDSNPGSPVSTGSFSAGGTLNGFLVGVGVEHALTRNWTVKLEYDYIGYGSKELSETNCRSSSNACGVTGTDTFSSTKQVFKVGVNYLFDVGH
jgi:outer membrane immunogenic protein